MRLARNQCRRTADAAHARVALDTAASAAAAGGRGSSLGLLLTDACIRGSNLFGSSSLSLRLPSFSSHNRRLLSTANPAPSSQMAAQCIRSNKLMMTIGALERLDARMQLGVPVPVV